MRVREDLHPLIRLDSVASIQNDGLVGNKFIQIESGTEQAAVVPDRGTIKPRAVRHRRSDAEDERYDRDGQHG